MPTPTYTLIDSVTLGSSASSVTFSGISATGKGDLVCSIEALADSGTAYFLMRFNGETTGYTSVAAYGTGSTTGSLTQTSLVLSTPGATTSQAALVTTTVSDFSSTDKHKSVLSRGNNASLSVSMYASRWANTAAITTLEIYSSVSSYAAGSTFHLYQIVSE